VRAAIEAAADPARRAAGLDDLWRLAQTRGESAPALVRASAALFTALSDPRADEALSAAIDRNPEDADLWRLMAATHVRLGERQEGRGAGLLADALEAGRSANRLRAADLLRKTLGLIRRAQGRAFVLGRLGDYAVEAQDFRAAAGLYREALALQRQRGDLAALALEANKLSRVLAVLGERAGACAVLREAAARGAVVTNSQANAACGAP
jgi:tetratricopeptide (TPR) repeat protein